VPATFQNVDIARFCPLLLVLTINVQPAGGLIVGMVPPMPAPSCAVMDATMTSLACVAAGRLMLSDVALLAVPLLALTAPRNPMMIAPGQVSSTSHSFAAARQTAPALPGGCWQVVLAPSQVSVVQGSPSAGQAAPALPAGCGQVVFVPLHTSAVQGLPSSVQGVPLGWKTSAGQVVLVPVQVSATSHPLTAARQTVVVLVFSGCWQATLVPSHWSSVQGLPSSVHAVPLAFRAPVSAGHA